GGAPDAHPDRHRRAVPERPLAAPQPRRGLADAALAPLRARDAKAHGRAAEAGRHQDRRRLGPPDPQLRARPEPHQGPAHERGDIQHPEGAGRRRRAVHHRQPDAAHLMTQLKPLRLDLDRTLTDSMPHPDIFLEAAKRLGVDPAECLVFEDAPLGIEAARRAGMKAVALTTTMAAAAFAGFDNVVAVVPDLLDIRLTLPIHQP